MLACVDVCTFSLKDDGLVTGHMWPRTITAHSIMHHTDALHCSVSNVGKLHVKLHYRTQEITQKRLSFVQWGEVFEPCVCARSCKTPAKNNSPRLRCWSEGVDACDRSGKNREEGRGKKKNWMEGWMNEGKEERAVATCRATVWLCRSSLCARGRGNEMDGWKGGKEKAWWSAVCVCMGVRTRGETDGRGV